MPTTIITLPIHTIEQARALAGLLRAFIDDNAPDTNDGQDYKPDPDLAGIAALWCHLDAALKTREKPALDMRLCGVHVERASELCFDCANAPRPDMG